MGHPALIHLKEHIESMDNFDSQYETVEKMDQAKQHVNGVYHLQYISLHLNKY